MAITPITSDRFANKRWRENGNYQFAQSRMICELAVQEIPMASLSYPVAILAHEEQYHFIALLGVKQKENLFVSAEGRWLGRYIPAVLRAYPFRLTFDDTGSKILCIDEDGGVIGEDGERFYEEDGSTPSAAIKEKMTFVSTLDRGLAEAVRLAKLLAAEDLLTEWNVSQTGNDEQAVQQQLRIIDAVRLQEMASDKLGSLRDEGALPIAYAQIFSMLNLRFLQGHADLNRQVKGRDDDLGGILGETDDDRGGLNFDNL